MSSLKDKNTNVRLLYQNESLRGLDDGSEALSLPSLQVLFFSIAVSAYSWLEALCLLLTAGWRLCVGRAKPELLQGIDSHCNCIKRSAHSSVAL